MEHQANRPICCMCNHPKDKLIHMINEYSLKCYYYCDECLKKLNIPIIEKDGIPQIIRGK